MTTSSSKIVEKSVRVVEFSGKKGDWEAWSQKFLSRSQNKGYKALLAPRGGKSLRIPTIEEYLNALDILNEVFEEDLDIDAEDSVIEAPGSFEGAPRSSSVPAETKKAEKIKKLWKLNSLAMEDLLLSIDHTTSQGQVALSLVKTTISECEFPDGNAVMAWSKLKSKYSPVGVVSLLNCRKNFGTVG